MSTTRNKYVAALLLLTAITGLHSCKADVDLNNIDKRIEAEMGIALPVGNMLFTTNDFLGGGQVQKICVDQDGIYHYFDTLKINEKDYHPIDLAQYVGLSRKDFCVKTQLENNGYLDASGWVKDDKKDQPIELKFPLTLQLGSINSDPGNERLDSVQVSNSLFTSIINIKDMNLKWEWINSVDVELHNQFRRSSGKTVRLYTKGDGYNYDTDIPVLVDQFTVSLMKDKSAAPGEENVTDTCGFTFLFNFTVPKEENVQIVETSAFDYQFQTQFIHFDAAWGFFQASNQMRDRDVVSIDSLWSDWKNMKKMKVKLMEPAMTIEAYHHVAAPLIVCVDTIMAVNATEKVAATWNGNTHTRFALKEVFSPYSDNLNDSVWNSQMFNHEADKGHLDQLFLIRPDTLMYSYTIKVNPDALSYSSYFPWKQHRVTPNTTMNGHVILDVPFKVDKESEIEYVTKISDVRFDKVNLDSLLKTVKVMEKTHTRHIKLYMQLDNSLPFSVNAKIWFLNQDSSEVNLPLFEGQDQNELNLPAPKMIHNNGDKYGKVTEPSSTTVIVDVDAQKFHLLNQCKHLKLDAYMGSNPEPCYIDTTTSIKVHIGVAADVQAVINLNKQ